MDQATVKYVSESFIKPNLENVRESNQKYILSPWDLRLLFIHYTQKGLIFAKPSPQTFPINKLVETLKDSLALTLVHFYPLAGQLTTQIDQQDHKCVVLVDYNKGPGAHFIHATLDVTISDILSPTYIPSIVYSLFNHNEGAIVNYEGQSRPLLSVQVTDLLDGVFIGCSTNHAVLGGVSLDNFLSIWPEIHSANISSPTPISRHPIPLIGERSFEYAFTYTSHPNEFVTRYKTPPEMKARIFHFSTEYIKWLKNKANKDISNNNNINISSFQALSALVWRAIVRAIGLSPHEVTNCSLPINVKKILDPPLPQEFFGNIVDGVVATTTVDELLRHNLGWAALLLRESIHNYDSKTAIGFINRWLEAPFFVDFNKMVALKWVTISGSPTFDRYSHKFDGLGAPIAIRNGIGNKFPGKVHMSRAYEGGSSVDVEICLLPQSMATLESDQEFMDAVSLAKAQVCD